MVIKKNFAGMSLKFPSGSGPIDEKCEYCDKKLWAQFGENRVTGKFFFDKFCTNMKCITNKTKKEDGTPK